MIWMLPSNSFIPVERICSTTLLMSQKKGRVTCGETYCIINQNEHFQKIEKLNDWMAKRVEAQVL